MDFIPLKQVGGASTRITGEEFIFLKQMRDESIQMTSEDFIFPETKTRDLSIEISQDEFNALEQTNLKGNYFVAKRKMQSSQQNRNMNVSSNKMLTHDRYAQNQSRPEVCGIRQKVVLNLNKGINPDSEIDISGKRSQIELDKNRSTSIIQEFQSYEKSLSENQIVQVHGNLLFKKLLITGQNSASNKNISQNRNSPAKVSDSEGSKRKIGFSIDDILAFPGPSRSHENDPQSNLCPEDLKNRLIQQPIEQMKKTPMCSVCNMNFSEQTQEEFYKGKKILKCCQCRYSCDKVDYLLRHICMVHLPEPFFCNKCNVLYAEAGSHESEHKCDVCKKKFQCKNQLEDHYLVHDGYHNTFCRICKDDIYNHGYKRKGRIVYKCCCQCPEEFKRKSRLLNHLLTHSTLKLYRCNYCEERFTQKNKRLAHSKSHPKCNICKKTFFDRNYLIAHRLKEHRHVLSFVQKQAYFARRRPLYMQNE